MMVKAYSNEVVTIALVAAAVPVFFECAGEDVLLVAGEGMVKVVTAQTDAETASPSGRPKKRWRLAA